MSGSKLPATLKLIHYSADELQAFIVRPVNPYPPSKDNERLPLGKPVGFWVSVEGPDSFGWSNWCNDTDWQDRLKYAYEVKLAPDANILYLSTGKDIDDFTKKYRDHDNPTNKILTDSRQKFGGGMNTMYIDWGKVAREGYQGIIITPYVYSRRIAGHCTWYYGWDCASGCIWDSQAIQSVGVLEVSRG